MMRGNFLHEYVLKTGSNSSINKKIINYLKIYPKEKDIKNEEGFTPLMLASMNSNCRSTIETVKILLESGADVNIQDDSGRTALMHAVICSPLTSSKETVKILLEKGSDVNVQDLCERTALIHAFMIQNIEIETVKILLEKGSDVNVQDLCERTALIHAFMIQNIEIETIKILLEHNANPNLEDGCRRSALVYALLSLNNFEKLELLIKYKANTEIEICWNTTVTSYSFKKNNPFHGKNGVVEALLPNRKVFIQKIYLNKNREINKFWRFGCFDFKLSSRYVTRFMTLSIFCSAYHFLFFYML